MNQIFLNGIPAKNGQLIRLRYSLFDNDELVAKGTYTINTKTPSRSLVPLGTYNLDKDQMDIVFVAEYDLANSYYSNSEFLAQSAFFTAVKTILWENNELRENWSNIRFWVDTKNIIPGKLNEYKEKCIAISNSYHIKPEATMILHRAPRVDDFCYVDVKIGTAEFNCAYSLNHELSHILFHLSDEYTKTDTVTNNYKGKYVTPLRKHYSNLFHNFREAKQACEHFLVPDSNIKKVGVKHYLESSEEEMKSENSFYKICSDDCFMNSGSCEKQMTFNPRCSNIISEIMKFYK